MHLDEADLAIMEANGVDERTQALIEALRNAQDEAAGWETRCSDLESSHESTVDEMRDQADDALLLLERLRSYLADAPRNADLLADDIEKLLKDIVR